MIRVEIVAPVYNRREITLQCLRSLRRAKSENIAIHVVIVDDGSTDGTGEAVKKDFPEVQLVKGDGNLWFTEGTNVGVRAALERDPEYILMINDDQVFDPDFLRYMVGTAEKYPRSIVGSLLLLWDMPHRIFQVAPRWKTFKGGWQHSQNQTVWTIPEMPWEVELIVGNCVLVPVEAIREAGLMDSKRYPNFGDAEYTPRLKKKGWRLLIDPRARVFCQPNDVPRGIGQMSWREMPNALFFNLKHIQNLRRRFYSHLDSAPTKTKGILGFGFFLSRAIWQKFKGGKALSKDEKNFSVEFADVTVKD